MVTWVAERRSRAGKGSECRENDSAHPVRPIFEPRHRLLSARMAGEWKNCENNHTSADSEIHAMQWYALKVFYNKTAEIRSELEPEGVECYVPVHTVIVERNGVKRKTVRPVVGSLLFFRATADCAAAIGTRLDSRAMLYTRDVDGMKKPAAIPDREMDIFRLVASSGADGLEYMPDGELRFHTGQRVRVTGGPLAGAEGHITRIRGDRRLVVSVHGICAIATAYIPQCFLEQI